MEKRAQNKLKMYKLVISTCTEHPAAVSSISSLQPVITDVELKVQLLEDLALEQSSLLMGIKEKKDKHRLTTIAKLQSVAGALEAYALASGDTVLRTKVHLAPSILKIQAGFKTMQAIDRVLEAANDHIPDLQLSGILPADITDLQTLRDELDVLFMAVRNAIAERKTKTKDVRKLMRELDNLIKGQLDNLVLVIRDAHPQFFDRYHAARMVVDYKGKTKSLSPPSDLPGLIPPPENIL